MRRESPIKANLMKKVRAVMPVPEFVTFRIEDRYTSGIPDIVINGHMITSWWEVKHVDASEKTIDSKSLQDLTCVRLASAACYVRYIVYRELPDGSQVSLIVHPHNIRSLEPEMSFKGYNHLGIATFMRGVHIR